MKAKMRLDARIAQIYPDLSKTYIQSMIMQGKVTVNGTKITKSGTQVSFEDEIVVDLTVPKYVSRAGLKLEKALQEFSVDPKGMIVMDAGLSTGGFSDCLLQHGAQKIYGIDVGYGQVHEKIRHDDRVVVMERTNLRNLESLPEMVDLVTLDLSFISVLKVMDAVKKVLKDKGKLIVLIKPQFEGAKHEVGKGGIVRDDEVRTAIVNRVINGITNAGFQHIGLVESPITGTQGNKEFLAYFEKLP